MPYCAWGGLENGLPISPPPSHAFITHVLQWNEPQRQCRKICWRTTWCGSQHRERSDWSTADRESFIQYRLWIIKICEKCGQVLQKLEIVIQLLDHMVYFMKQCDYITWLLLHILWCCHTGHYKRTPVKYQQLFMVPPNVDMRARTYTYEQAKDACRSNGLFLSQTGDTDKLVTRDAFVRELTSMYNVSVWDRHDPAPPKEERAGVICEQHCE